MLYDVGNIVVGCGLDRILGALQIQEKGRDLGLTEGSEVHV